MSHAALQTEAQGQLQAAEVRQKGLKKQLAEQRKALASKEKEAGGLAQTLQKEQQKVDECSRRRVPLIASVRAISHLGKLVSRAEIPEGNACACR